MPKDEALLALIASHTPKPKHRPEGAVSDKIPALALKLRTKLWRNTVGRTQDRHGRWITYGLGVGSSDHVGYQVRLITPEMVGQKIAVFAAIEVKRPGRETTEKHHLKRQQDWIADVVHDGGIGGFVRSEQDLVDILKPI